MSSYKMLFSCVFVVCTLFTTNALAETFVEKNGIVVWEAESSGAGGGWSLQKKFGGYKGSGYLIWTGTDAFGKSTAGRGTKTFTIRIQKAGNYQMRWRSRIGKGTSRTEHNDSWIRFPTGKNISGEQALNGWTKVFMNTRDAWVWQSATVDNVGKPVRQYFSKGIHTVQISGRSSGHAIDRIALYHYPSVNYSASKFDALGQSGSSTTTQTVTAPEPEPAPEPAPEPEPTPEPEPAPEPEPEPEPTPPPAPAPEPEPAQVTVSNVSAPSLSVAGMQLSWNSVDAIAFNVHRGNGEWIESLQASQTQWSAPAAGTYYIVATGPGAWETWGRSETVTVESTAGAVANTLGLYSQVYSGSALELFWSSPLDELSFEVYRNNSLLTISDGRSYFDEGLSSGTSYEYKLVAINRAGDEVMSETISATTTGAPTNTQATDAYDIDLRATAYSQSAIELFWSTVSMASGEAYQFQVFQDGQLLTQTDGRSFFYEGLSAGTNYSFLVQTLDSAGNTLLSSQIDVTTYPADSN